MKLARTEADDGDIRAEFDALRGVSQLGALPNGTLPHPVMLGAIQGRAACVLTAVPGEKSLLWTAATDSLLTSVAERLHAIAAVTRRAVSAASGPTRTVLERAAGTSASGVLSAHLETAFNAVCEMWDGHRERPAVLMHGDCTGSNILFGPAGPGFIDWTGCVEDGFEHVDALWLSWYLLTKHHNLPPEHVVGQLLRPDSRSAVGRFLVQIWADEDAMNRKRAVLTMLTVLAARYVRAGHHERALPVFSAASQLAKSTV
jgi:Ser/Thr protein kinase RdoA (MazF antagonist)